MRMQWRNWLHRALRQVLCCVSLAATTGSSANAASPACCDDFAYASPCDEACDALGCGTPICDRWFLAPQSEDGLNFTGWLNGGFVGNTSSPGSKFNGPYNAVDRANEPMFNQAYMISEIGLPRSGMGLGARLDLLYGEDFLLAQSVGMETRPDGSSRWNGEYYGLALPQAYVSVGSRDLFVQTGHFYSIVGYEGVMAPDNFFYSKSYSYQFAGPFTHWGTQATWNATDAATVQAGLINGWNALDRASDKLGFIGKVRFDDRDSGAWTSFAVVTGDEFNNVADLNLIEGYANRTRWSWLVGLPLAPRFDYVFHQWAGFQDEGALGGNTAWWYGIDQYAYLQVNRTWKAGMRFEWFRDEDGTRVGLNRARNQNNPPFVGNFYSVAVGMNWSPTTNLLVRPEIRGDWYDGNPARLPFQDGARDSQLLLGIDGILLF